MAFGAHQDAYGRPTGQTALGYVPAGSAEDRVPAGGQSGEVRHRAAGHEADRAAAGQFEQIEQPRAGDVLHCAVRGGDAAQRAVLVPRADEPVGRQGRRVGSTHDETEETPRWHRRQARFAGLRQQVDHRGRVASTAR